MGTAIEKSTAGVDEVPLSAAMRGKIAPVKFAHIVLKTNRYRRMLDWYKTVLEVIPVLEEDNLCFMTYDEEHHRIAIVEIPMLLTVPKFLTGIDHMAYTYESIGDLLFTYKRLKNEGITPYWTINHGPTISMYYHDPDGNSVELQVDSYDSPHEASAIFLTEDFKNNPLGEDFDPEDMARRYDAGESIEELRVFQVRTKRSALDLPAAHVGRFHSMLARIARMFGA